MSSTTSQSLSAGEQFLASLPSSVPTPELYADVPIELKTLDNWVVWKIETRDGKPTKPPYDANQNGKHVYARTDNAATWSSFARAIEVTSGTDYEGVGFVFTDTDYVGSDLDGVVHDDATIEPFAVEIIKLASSYCELSPSGTGVHVIVKSSLPLPQGNRKGTKKLGGEIYNKTSPRYFTFTGNKIDGLSADSIAKIDDPDQIGLLHFMVLHLHDTKLTNLWMGDSSLWGANAKYPSQSEADEALCSLLAPMLNYDFQKIEKYFGASKLGQRDKWIDRPDYRKRTIQLAIGDHRPASVASNQSDAKAESPDNPIARPALDEVALYGLAGRIIKKLQPQTESHPAGNLGELLLSFGNLIGRCAFYQVESTRHYTNENMVKVGESAKARKGTGKNRIREIFDSVDTDWRRNCDVSGVGSGEAIINLIRDEHHAEILNRRSGHFEMTLVDKGVTDKRACVNIGEFQGILAVCHKPEGLLSVVLRDGWDGVPLRNTVKTSPACCMEPHLSILGDTTQADLSTSLTQADRTNGFANRFLWVYVYRTRFLAHGGEDIDWHEEADQLIQAAEFARSKKRIFMSKPAYDYWERTLYPKLERDVPGFVGTLVSRASAHVIRLALIHALMNQSDHIEVEHLKAAAAFWQYCEDSVQTIFGNLLSPEQSQIVDFLATVGTATKTRVIHDCFKKNRRADLIQNDLDSLMERSKITREAVDGVWNYSLRSMS